MLLPNSKYIAVLEVIIRFVVKILASLMIVVIFVGVGDVVYELYQRIIAPPKFFLSANDMLVVFGSFMLVLIAIEIFINIVVYLREEVIHVRIVLATAIVAVARKVIVFDYTALDYKYVIATGVVIISLCAGYWLTGYKYSDNKKNTSDVRVSD